MGEPSDETTYILLGINAAGGIPAMELRPARSVEDAFAQARVWLQSHPSCNCVQIWREPDLLLGEIKRNAPS